MGVNGVDTPDPHIFSAETDRFPAVTKRLNALSNHVINGDDEVGRLKCWPTRVSSLWGFNCGSVTIILHLHRSFRLVLGSFKID